MPCLRNPASTLLPVVVTARHHHLIISPATPITATPHKKENETPVKALPLRYLPIFRPTPVFSRLYWHQYSVISHPNIRCCGLEYLLKRLATISLRRFGGGFAVPSSPSPPSPSSSESAITCSANTTTSSERDESDWRMSQRAPKKSRAGESHWRKIHTT